MIYNRFGIKAKLIKGQDGVFSVVVNDEVVFSKKVMKRFPQNNEIIKIVRSSL